jgi:hypothetical protein
MSESKSATIVLANGHHRTEAPRSFLRFVAIQGVEREQDLSGLAPKGCLIAAQAIECEVPNAKATRESPVRTTA